MNHMTSISMLFVLFFAGALMASAVEQENNETLSLDEARRYMVTLINKHRATEKLAPVSLDAAASIAGQEHSDEMATRGYLGHLDVAGRKPWERYTVAGGRGYVSENTYKTFSGKGSGDFVLKQSKFSKRELEEAEDEFFFEKPPADGHRRNILDPNHDGVGIGLSKGVAGDNDCFTLTQEFTENKGTFEEIPVSFDGKPIRIKGRLLPGYSFDYLTIEYDPLPTPKTPAELDKIPSYDMPAKTIQTAWPPAFESEFPVDLQKNDGCDEFSVTITPDPKWENGIYYAVVWVKDKSGKQLPVSCRTIRKSG